MPLRSLAALLFCAVAALPASAGSARAGAFIDAAGRRVVLPDHVGRVLPAERDAEVLVFVLAPDKLAGLEHIPGRNGLMPRGRRLPVLGWRPQSNPANMAATARRLGADLIIDAGPVTPGRAAFADQVEQQSGIPYILVDDSFSRMPSVLRILGSVLGASDRAGDLALFTEHAIAGLRGRLLIRAPDTRPHVYYGLGPSGLEAALPGSPAGAALAEAGAINVAAPAGFGGEVAVRREQLLGWDPQIIIAERRSFYEALRHSPAWRRLSAVRHNQVYLEPTNPFGWIEDPAGVNRLIGLYWLSSLFYADATQEDLRTTACDFYDKFYRIKLTNAQIEALVRPAGASPLAAPRQISGPLVGLGAAPPSSLPAGAPGAPSATPAAPGAEPAMPGIVTNTAPSDRCTVPTGPSPQPLPGITGLSPDDLSPAPRVSPPGRRGRPPG